MSPHLTVLSKPTRPLNYPLPLCIFWASSIQSMTLYLLVYLLDGSVYYIFRHVLHSHTPWPTHCLCVLFRYALIFQATPNTHCLCCLVCFDFPGPLYSCITPFCLLRQLFWIPSWLMNRNPNQKKPLSYRWNREVYGFTGRDFTPEETFRTHRNFLWNIWVAACLWHVQPIAYLIRQVREVHPPHSGLDKCDWLWNRVSERAERIMIYVLISLCGGGIWWISAWTNL